MDNNVTATSGANSETSGSESLQKEQNSTSGENSSTTAYEKLLREKKNTASALINTKSELEELKSWKAKIEEDELLKKQEYETVIQNYKKKLTEAEEKANYLSETIQGSKKNSAILSELKKLGFVDNEANKEAVFKLVDKKQVSVDPTTGVILGADDAAKDFVAKYGTLGFFGKESKGVNHDAPNFNLNMPRDIGKMTREEMNKIPVEERLKLLASMASKP